MSKNNTESLTTSRGSCLCKNIRFLLTGSPINTVLCHCDNCGRTSGVGFMANSFFKKTQVDMVSDTSIKTYEDSNTDSGGTINRQFCGNCGSPLFTTNASYPELIIVTSGSLEKDVGRFWVPKMELYCKGRRAWLGAVNGTQKFDVMF
ncbi:Mss4-like protein [Clohesyomyces aquaticus]|uniref:Mss4-like protein n=1 Tax=Clohesyomyces aquaticus TaxID=1231657 RepID=A0A1Y1YL14_9PLEO|nr:Mss4-like protein [Clohesyomyces aquaticus]